MENLKIGKISSFKNINGKYTSFEPIIIDFPISTVSYHLDENLFIYLNTFTTKFVNDLKQTLVNKVYEQGIYKVSKETLSEFYVNPHKNIKYRDVLKLKNYNEGFLKKGTRVKLNVAITGLWFSEASFGPYISIHTLEVIVHKPLFIQSDSDTDLEI
jgi:hypothetical protein